MRKLPSEHSKAIFSQLASQPGPDAVATVIENHAAWVASDAAFDRLMALPEVGRPSRKSSFPQVQPLVFKPS